jgi:hypothetical protein
MKDHVKVCVSITFEPGQDRGTFAGKRHFFYAFVEDTTNIDAVKSQALKRFNGIIPQFENALTQFIKKK